MPVLIGLDKQNHVLVLEDLGKASDFTYLYHFDKKLNQAEIHDLVHYLNQLHKHFQKYQGGRKIANMKMRKLNHEHIFHYPFWEENGFDLDTVQTGLQAVALKYKRDAKLKKCISALGEAYLSSGDTLLHGDFYPGSWLRTEQGIKIIDPEFCFYGCKEFDLAVMIAHLYLGNHDDSAAKSVLDEYSMKTHLDMVLLNQFIGVEIMRRLIGLAQLPLKADLAFRETLLEKAYKLLMK